MSIAKLFVCALAAVAVNANDQAETKAPTKGEAPTPAGNTKTPTPFSNLAITQPADLKAKYAEGITHMPAMFGYCITLHARTCQAHTHSHAKHTTHTPHLA